MNIKRILVIAIGLVVTLIAVVAGVSAQESTPEPTTPESTPEASVTEVTETPFLGVFYDNTAEELVIEVMRRSPAFDAGLQDGDIITAVNGEAVTPATFSDAILAFAPNDTITVTVERGGESLDIEVTLGLRSTIETHRGIVIPEMGEIVIPDGAVPPMEGFFEAMPFGRGGMGFGMMPTQGRLGVTFMNVDATIAEDKGLSVTEGAIITAVDADSPAEAAGFLVDDVITAVNGEPVDAERTLADRMVAYEPEDVVTFTVLRGGETVELTATLGQQEQRLMGEMGDVIMGMGGVMPSIQIMPHGMMPNNPHGMMPPVEQTTPAEPPVEVTPNA